MTLTSDSRRLRDKRGHLRWGRAGFSLIEIISVLAIVAIISAIAVSTIPMLQRTTQIDSSATSLFGLLEQAHDAAMSSNTYVWVAFANSPATASFHGSWVALIQSQDGTESPVNTTPTPNWQTSLTIPGNNLQLLSKIQSLNGVSIVPVSALPSTLTGQAGVPTGAAAPFAATWTVTPLQNIAGSTVNFTYVIEFAPSGDAHVPTWSNNIQFGLVPVQGKNTNSVLFNVSRLTGKTTMYRP